MTPRFILILTVVGLVSASALVPIGAKADCMLSEDSPHLLRVQISKQDSLSRSELDQNQLSLASPQPAPVPSLTASLSQTSNPGSNLQNQTAFLNQAASSAALNARAAESDLASDVRLREYNVDWASWIAKLADRWYFVLRSFEQAGGMQFVTQGPALFQFTCYENGTIGNIIMKQSSGNPIYDRLQVLALMQAMPIPPFPNGTHRQTITLVQGWESHLRQAGETEYIPGSFGKGFPMEKVREWVRGH